MRSNRHVIGVANMMWSTDYPHHGCDWPETRRVVDEMSRDVPADERQRMCALNAARLYKLVGLCRTYAEYRRRRQRNRRP